MTSRKRIACILSASLFVASIGLAATTTPTASPPTSPTVPTPATPTATTPVLLWLYGDPNPQWVTLDYFPDVADCETAMATIRVAPPQRAACYPAGVDPDRLHEQYGSLTSTPAAK